MNQYSKAMIFSEEEKERIRQMPKEELTEYASVLTEAYMDAMVKALNRITKEENK